jgi:hypothetical protein
MTVVRVASALGDGRRRGGVGEKLGLRGRLFGSKIWINNMGIRTPEKRIKSNQK